MSNMSYCRFENTLDDLKDCYENMDNASSDTEKKKRKQLIELCIDIALDYCDEVDKNIIEEQEAISYDYSKTMQQVSP